MFGSYQTKYEKRKRVDFNYSNKKYKLILEFVGRVSLCLSDRAGSKETIVLKDYCAIPMAGCLVRRCLANCRTKQRLVAKLTDI